ncbi:hypothetical protein ACFVZZ_17080 [Streptomyces chartreusis]|uniref:hypothetical protein n=1 Tax=Streptomyces chartreusis TaxID=1969 RepID=UPI0036D8137C
MAIDPAPFRGVLPRPVSELRSSAPVLSNPANRRRAVPLTFEQVHYSFANAVGEEEAKDQFETFAVPAPGAPIFQAATANLNPWTRAGAGDDTGVRRRSAVRRAPVGLLAEAGVVQGGVGALRRSGAGT